MPARQATILQVALPVPLRRTFDYLLPPHLSKSGLLPGTRLKVPFGNKSFKIGILVGISDKSEIDLSRLKFINAVIDESPLFPQTHLNLLQWASDYYQHPIGDVIFSTLPSLLKQERVVKTKPDYVYKASDEGIVLNSQSIAHAPAQMALLELLKNSKNGFSAAELNEKLSNWRRSYKLLEEKGYLKKEILKNSITPDNKPAVKISLNKDQLAATRHINSNLFNYKCVLLDGVTGSGKTEVYIEIMQNVISHGKQVLLMVPEIALTPQLITRINQQIRSQIVVLHSSLSKSERLEAWMAARDGSAGVVVGTRSAIWTPLKNPGLFIVDEEHDLSYKQQDGFRYSARDVAIMRARNTKIPVILGTATPSMESLKNVKDKKFSIVHLRNRASNAQPPKIRIIDIRARQMHGAISDTLIHTIENVLSQGLQVLLFLNRRGFSPVLMCHNCSWRAVCQRCDLPQIFHKHENKLSCHHCDSKLPVPDNCPECGSANLLQLGHGTQRIVETLREFFPGSRILRIDRDSTRRKGSMNKMMHEIISGTADILVGTQMLAKGHDFPGLNMVGIIDVDRGLVNPDFRASERMAQLFTQVCGRAGRSDKIGEVLVQTHYPNHPLLLSLVKDGYSYSADKILAERRLSELPPYSFIVLLRAESNSMKDSETFLKEARSKLEAQTSKVQIYGPVPAPLEKRAGRYRYQLIIQSKHRNLLNQELNLWSRSLEQLSSSKKARWSIDVDPQDML